MRWILIIKIIAVLSVLKLVSSKKVKQFQGFRLPCANTSPECLKESLQAVIPEFIQGLTELDIPSLDPFQVDELVLHLPGEIKIEFKDAYTKGLKKCTVDYVKKITDERFEIQFDCTLFSKGKYRSTGHLLMFSIDGEGKSTIICKNLKVQCSFNLKSKTKADGENYMEINNFTTTHKYSGRVIYNMTNLFKGNPEMSQLVLDFMNKNWRLVADEFGSPIIEFGINNVLKNIRKLLNTVPIKDLMIF